MATTSSKSTSTSKRVPGRTVYIGLRKYDTTRRRLVNCKGFNIRAFDFSPEEVHRIILDALRAAAEDYQLKQRARKALA